MTFEEEFPSLKGKRINVPDCQKCSEGQAFLSGVIEECCLDKERVKEVINDLVISITIKDIEDLAKTDDTIRYVLRRKFRELIFERLGL